MPIADAYELAYRESVRALEHQQTAATELQSRAGTLLAAASISLSYLGRDAFATVHALAWLALLCFALLSLCVLAIVWPRALRDLEIDPQALLAGHLASGGPDVAALSAELVAHIGFHCRANRRLLAQMSRMFRTGACLLAIQLVLTVLAVTVTL